MKKIKLFFKGLLIDIKKHYIFYSIYLVVLITFFIPLNYYVYLPGGLIDLEDRIIIDSPYASEGSFNLTFVSGKKGVLPVVLLSYIIPSWDLVPISDNQIEDESDKEITLRNQIYLKETSYDAIIAAFKSAGKEYKINNIDLTITYIYEDAKTDLEIGDIITEVDGNTITDYDSLRTLISKYNVNDKVNIKVKRNDKIVDCYAYLYMIDDRVVIGVYLSEIKDIETNPSVEFVFKNTESGASRGLMCALEIYNRITPTDLTKGLTISGTGSIDEDGNVGAIDGVKYKLKGAVKNKADIFIVPTDNYDEAIKLKNEYNYDIDIVKVSTLNDAINYLNNL